MKTRVTQNDIARAAGVHNTTVSLALRNSPAIPEATRKRIQAIADEMGYYPDPALQALVAYRNGRSPSRRQETLAYVTNWYTKWGWQDEPAHAKYYVGAQRKAAECGYQIEHFWLGEEGMSQRRLNSMLFHRGITGVILASHRPDVETLLELDWPQLTVVKIGHFPRTEPLHRLMDDHPGVLRQAMKRVLAAGYERVGLVLPQWWDQQAEQAWSISFVAEQSRLPQAQRIAPLLYGAPGADGAAAPGTAGRAVGLTVLDPWLQRHQPEVVMSFGSSIHAQFDALGVQVPRDLAYVDLFLDGADRRFAGIRENCERVGEVAIENLVAQMQQNIRGLPDVGTTTLVEGAWQDGDSLPTPRPAAAWRPNARTFEGYTEKLLLAAP